MAVQTQALPLVEVASDNTRRFTVKEYAKILETGIFDDERVELLNGIITIMSPINDKHRGIVARVARLLNIYNLIDYFYSPQSNIDLSEHSKPQPDMVVAAPHESDYIGMPLSPKDIYLVIEVADSSLRYDRKVKVPTYAAAGIVEYWIINLQDHQIEVFKQAKNADYQTKTIAKAGETVTCEAIGFTLHVDEVFKGLEKT